MPTYDTEQKKRWAEHFKETLNTHGYTVDFAEETKPTILPLNVGEINEIEIKEAIKSLANKATHDDDITAEMLKASDDVTVKRVQDLFNRKWIEEKVPS